MEPSGKIPDFDSLVAYEVKVQFNKTGHVVGIAGPDNMPLPVVIDHLATAIKAIAFGMTNQQPEPSRIIKPQLVGVKKLS
jgi:hypothetical protein